MADLIHVQYLVSNLLRYHISSHPTSFPSQHSPLLIKILRPLPPHLQHTLREPVIPRRKLNPKIPRNRHQRTLNLVIIHIIRVRRVLGASLDLVQADEAEKSAVDEF